VPITRWMSLGILGLSAAGCDRGETGGGNPAATHGQHIVSLVPAITEALFEIGAGEQVVAVSDYCLDPEDAARLPRVGTALKPDLERIARMQPTLILAEDNKSAATEHLSAISTARFLKWLTLDDVVSSLAELGVVTGCSKRAEGLARDFARTLKAPAPADAPTVLLVLGYNPGKLDEVWFIKDDSLHGAALRAAGGRNAVLERVEGFPRLGLERLIGLDPEMVIVLSPHREDQGLAEALLDDWREITALRAVRTGRLAAIISPTVMSTGPRILQFTDRLAAEIRRLKAIQ